MGSASMERGLLWAAELGEICGRAGDGLAPEWGFLDLWIALVGAEVGCLQLVRPGGGEESFSRGVVPAGSAAEGPELELRDSDEGAVLRIAVQAPDGLAASLIAGPADADLLGVVRPLVPLVQRALLRLAQGPQTPAVAAAMKAWVEAPGPMLLLSESFDVIATNPSASRVLETEPGGSLPEWLGRWLRTELADERPPRHRNWTAGVDGAEYLLAVFAVDPAEATPGRWLVCLNRGGPNLAGRLGLAVSEFGLTPREGQAFELLAEGLSNRRIGEALGVAETTVKFHLISVMRKAGVSSRAELLARLHRLHLQDLDVSIPPDADRLSQAWVYEGEHDIVHWIQDEGAVMHGRDVEEFYDWIRRQTVSEHRVVYSDATGVKAADRSAHAATTGDRPEVAVAAIRGGTAVSRAIANLWLRLTSPAFEVRLFRDRAEAIEWLKEWR